MVDPLSLTVLGGVAAAEGIKFLYGQAAELIKAWNSRRAQDKDEAIDVPIIPADMLDRPPAAAKVDTGVLEAQQGTLVRLSGSLSGYALGLVPVTVQNDDLAADAGQLRAILEAIYGQRFTFRGEQRAPTGTRVTIEQSIVELQGLAVGLRGRAADGGETAIRQDVGVVGPEAKLYGQISEAGSDPSAP